MSYKAVTDMINNGSFKCVLLYGTEDYLIDECVRLAKNKFIEKSYEDMNYAEFEKLDDNFEAFREFAETFPFFSEKKLCVVKEAGFLTSLGSLDKKAEDKLLGIIEGSGDFCITIFLIKGGKPDSRKRTVKRLKDMNSVFEILRLNEGELTKHVAGRFKRSNVEISASDADYIGNNSGYLEYESSVSLYEINNEIDKIASFCMNERRVSRKDIDSLMIKSIESSIFKLVDFICEGNKDKALEILEDMIINNTPEQFIIHMIIRQYRMIYQYMLLKKKGYSQDEIMDRMKIKKFIAMKLSKLSGGLTLRKIDSYMDKFLEIDRKIKIGEIDNRIGLETITNGIIN